MSTAPRKPVAVAAKPAPVAAKPAPVAAMPAAVPVAAAKMEDIAHQAVEQTVTSAKDAQEQFRKVVEQSVAQSRAGYEKMKEAAEAATGSLESSYQAASKGVNALNAKAIDVFKAQSEANLEHVKAVMAAKTVGEAIALQSAHVRKQFDVFSAQAKELATMAQQIAVEAGEPLKASFSKSFAQH